MGLDWSGPSGPCFGRQGALFEDALKSSSPEVMQMIPVETVSRFPVVYLRFSLDFESQGLS